MNSERILIIEDEPKVALFIKQGLEEHGFKADIAYDGFTGKKKAISGIYGFIILDLNLPIMNGFEVCTEIRMQSDKIPILILTALGTKDDKLTGFDCGADDYLVKPFEFMELLARIKVFFKRINQHKPTEKVLRVADLEINIETKTVTRNNSVIDLTIKEFSLLELLMRNEGTVISRAIIAEKIWDINFDTGTNVIDVYINFLRKKVDKDHANKLIHTNIGRGYVLKES
ncbi:MAG: response regulator [Bacteroidia bacterium]